MKKLFILIFLSIFVFITRAQWVEKQNINPIPYLNNVGDDFAKSVCIADNYAVVGSPGYNNKTGGAYVLFNNGSSWEKVAVLTPSDGVEHDNFGGSVSICGDVIVIGARPWYVGRSNKTTGAAYVFKKPISGWTDMTETAKLIGSDNTFGSGFATSVCVYDNTIAVGSTYRGDRNSKGCVYVFENESSDWTDINQKAILTYPGGKINNWFGYSVDIYDDEIVTGASKEEVNGVQCGAVYVFKKDPTGWDDQDASIRLTGSDSDESGYFGSSVAISGGGIVIGAKQDDDDGYRSGSSYFFEKPLNGWKSSFETVKIKPEDGEYCSGFGGSVDISGDYILIGAYEDDDHENGLNNVGSVYVFKKPGSGWTEVSQIAKLTASDPHEQKHLGTSVSMSDDIIIAGTGSISGTSDNGGALYLYKKPIECWVDAIENDKILPTPYYKATNSTFGYDIAIDGDIAVVGSPGVNRAKGSVQIFQFLNNNWTFIAELTSSDGELEDYFGKSVSISGNTIAVGAIGDDDVDDECGAVYIFEKQEANWIDATETAKLIPSDGHLGSLFGSDVEIENDIVAVGAPFHQLGNIRTGAAYIFKRPESGWIDMSESAILTPSDGNENAQFGDEVCVSDNSVFIGANADGEVGNKKGAVYIYKKPSESWADMTESLKLYASNGVNNDRFGNSIDVYKDILVVGSDYNSHGFYDGSAYVFQRIGLDWIEIEEIAILNRSTYGSGYFGRKVQINENEIIVGNGAENYGTESCVYIYEKPEDGWSNSNETYTLVTPTSLSYDYGMSFAVNDKHLLIGARYEYGYSGKEGRLFCYSKALPTSIDEGFSKEIFIYPNPASDYLTISVPESLIFRVKITDLYGKVIKDVSRSSDQLTINIQEYSSGIYFVNVELANSKYVKKIIKL